MPFNAEKPHRNWSVGEFGLPFHEDSEPEINAKIQDRTFIGQQDGPETEDRFPQIQPDGGKKGKLIRDIDKVKIIIELGRSGNNRYTER